MTYAKGSRALGLCDRCGFQYRLNSLKFQVVEGRVTSLKVCRFCYDVDNEQWMARLVDYTDNQALRDPRPAPPEVTPDYLLYWGVDHTLNYGAYRPLLWRNIETAPTPIVNYMIMWGSGTVLGFGSSSPLTWDS